MKFMKKIEIIKCNRQFDFVTFRLSLVVFIRRVIYRPTRRIRQTYEMTFEVGMEFFLFH